MEPRKPVSNFCNNNEIINTQDSNLLQRSSDEKLIKEDFAGKFFSINTRPAVVVVCGLPGAGKTCFAVRFACLIDAGYLNMEQLRLKLFVKCSQSDSEKLVIYERMLQKAKHVLLNKKSIVLDGTFCDKQIRNMFLEELNSQGQVLFIEVQSNEALSYERISRNRSVGEGPCTAFKTKRRWNSLEVEHLLLQSTQINILDMLDKALQYYKKTIRIGN